MSIGKLKLGRHGANEPLELPENAFHHARCRLEVIVKLALTLPLSMHAKCERILHTVEQEDE